METKWKYFQYRKQHGYPIFVRFQNDEISGKFQHLLREMGFNELEEKDTRKISLQTHGCRVLTVQTAGPRVQMQISGSDLLDKFGLESLTLMAGTPIYTYRRVGLLALPPGKVLWDLGLCQNISLTDQLIGVRIVFVRFLAMALAEQGVLCYWGTVQDGTLILMKQNQSLGEAIVIDWEKKKIFSSAGEHSCGNHIRIIRKDKESQAARPMSREELISYLSVSTCLLSFTGPTQVMKKSIYALSAIASSSYASEGARTAL